ncbi:MAG: DUF4058 family protein [Bacteroidota bacterium]
MKSPFPGMNPFLEGDLCPEVHSELASKIKKLLIPQLGNNYTVRTEKYIVTDTEPQHDIGIVYPMYPDVGVFENKVMEPVAAYGAQRNPTPASFKVKYYKPVEVNIPVVEIKDVKQNRIITAIEILSPVNKRVPGLKLYLQKKKRLIDNGVHFMEIDLIRRGKRTIDHPQLDEILYLVALTRANSYETVIWTMGLTDTLPIVPIPLLPTDEDVLIDLQMALGEVYEESAFYRSIDYQSTPPPPFLATEDYQEYIT